MKISDKGLMFIETHEGFRNKAYKAHDSEKYYTIGFGHYGKDVKPGMTVSVEEGRELLAKDVEKSERYVNRLYDTYEWNQHEYDALVSFTYNCGNANLKQLTANGVRSRKTISEKMLLYTKAGGVKLQGLVKRRERESKMFKYGEYIYN